MLEQVDTCNGCTVGKYTKSSFHDRDNRLEPILEHVHSDVCGPFLTTSTDKDMYYVIFVDNFSGKCWIFSCIRKTRILLSFVNLNHFLRKILTGELKLSERQ